MNAPVVVSIWSTREGENSFLASGCLLDSQHVLTAGHILHQSTVYVKVESDCRRIRARPICVHDRYDAGLLELEESSYQSVPAPALLREPQGLIGELVAIHVISPTHKNFHKVPNYAIGSYDEKNGHYELSPENAEGHSGGVVVWRNMVVGLLVARAKNQPLCRAISLDRLFTWISSALPEIEFPPEPFIWRAGSSHLLSRVTAFRESYLVEGNHAEPFGGRDDEMSDLDSWLDDHGMPSRMLVSGPTGRGKSALLVRWTERVARSAAWKVVFVPISIRFETHRAEVYYELLASQLASIAGQILVSPAFDPEGFFLGISTSLIRELAEKGQRVVIVIDGVDEALDLQFNGTIFPRSLPPNVKVLCSAREQANDDGANGWLRRLEWERTGFAASHRLALFGESEVQDILESVKLPLADADGLVARITELSQGEPLLVKLYAEDLVDAFERGHPITVDQLAGLAKGFEPYFARAMENQRKSWEETGSKVDQDTIDVTLAILATAFGPLTRESLIRLVCDLGKIPEPLSVDRLIAPISRFVSGNGQEGSGYVLNHPKLGQFLREEKFEDAALRRAHSSFLLWGRDEAARLNEDSQFSIAPYLLQYFARHVEQSNDSLNDLWHCLSDGWRIAWERYEGGHHGYASSLLSILRTLDGTEERWSFSQSLHFRIKLALCVSSVKSIGANVPAELLRLALETQQLTSRQAMLYVQLQSLENQPSFYTEIFAHVEENEIDRALSSIRGVADGGSRAHLLARVAFYLPEEHRARILDEVRSLAAPFESAQTFPICVELATYVSPEELQALVSLSETLSPQYKHVPHHALSLGKLSAICLQRGDVNAHGRVLRCCLAMLDSIVTPLTRADVLCQLSDLIPRAEVESRIVELRAAVEDIARDPDKHVRLGGHQSKMILEMELAGVLKVCIGFELLRTQSDPAAQIATGLVALNNLAQRVDGFHLSDIFAYVLPLFASANRPEVAMMGFEFGRKLPTGNNRAHALLSLAKTSPTHLRPEFVKEALISARLIEDNFSRLGSLIDLASQLPEPERSIQVLILRREMDQIGYVLHRGEIALRLACLIQNRAELQTYGVALIKMTASRDFSVGPLLNALNELPDNLRRATFRGLMDEGFRPEDYSAWFHLALAADVAPDLWTKSDLRKALAGLRWCKDPFQRAFSLCSLAAVASRLGHPGVFDGAVVAVNEIPNPGQRLTQMVKLVSVLSERDERRYVVDDEWIRSVNAGVQFQYGEVLVAYPHLSVANQQDAWKQLLHHVDVGDDSDGNLRIRLAGICTDDRERVRLLQDAIVVVSESRGESRCGVAANLVLACEAEADQRRALFLAVGAPSVSRSSILMVIKRTAPVIARVGSVDLIRRLMSDIRETASWWP